MLAVKLLESFRAQLDWIHAEQLQNIERASQIIAQSALHGGAWHVYDTGHIINSELIHRAGGLMFMRPFSWSFSVNDQVPLCRRERPPADPDFNPSLEVVRLAVKASHIRAGDVITIGSVSGGSASVVELALACKQVGSTVIAISSFNYSSQITSKHPSGKRLFECADLFIDNGAPLGDGHMQVEGYDVPLFPLSGINAAVIMWMVVAGVVEKMTAAGSPPQVYQSVNQQGGAERNQRIEREIVDKVGY